MQSKYLLLFFILSFLIFSSPSCPSSSSSSSSNVLILSQEIGRNSPIVKRYRRLSSAKNGRPFPPSSDGDYFKERMTTLDKPARGFERGRQFSVMLPKGLVPPSSLSLCHNGYPDSITAHCELSSSKALSKGPRTA
ncbi:hypothetical protein MLD38_019259 [Melastoma candidum]|uniref:Uncharacterized protein n=1 Tax=Melastoma candidum TaxID=119954 RepID=A0ACB9QWF0_9MYRT|nr:hypothetical protein MLD38_019259 [Melastoma candidum]